MNKKISTCRNVHLFILAVGTFMGVAMTTQSVLAQTTEEITVTAPRVIQKQVGLTPNGVPLQETSLSYEITYADLDLTKPSDVRELERRIDTMAKEACRALDNLNPFNPRDPLCVTKAITSADDQKQQAIAAAHAK